MTTIGYEAQTQRPLERLLTMLETLFDRVAPRAAADPASDIDWEDGEPEDETPAAL
jgi:hypothetical protein